jgi:hypothetical protein
VCSESKFHPQGSWCITLRRSSVVVVTDHLDVLPECEFNTPTPHSLGCAQQTGGLSALECLTFHPPYGACLVLIQTAIAPQDSHVKVRFEVAVKRTLHGQSRLMHPLFKF